MYTQIGEYAQNVISQMDEAAQKMKNVTGKRDSDGCLSPEQNGLFFDFTSIKKRFINRSKGLIKRGKITENDVEHVVQYNLNLIKDLNTNYGWSIKVYEQDINGHCKEVKF